MQYKNYSKFVFISIFVSLFFLNCANNGNLNAVKNEIVNPENNEDLQSLNGSATFKVEAPENITKVEVIISSSDTKTPLIYNLFKKYNEWKGIISNLPAGDGRNAIFNAYNNTNQLLYQGNAVFPVIENNSIDVVAKLHSVDPLSPAKPLIQSVNLMPSKVAPGENINLELLTYQAEEDSDLEIQWSAINGLFDSPISETAMWTAPNESGIYQLTVSAKDSSNNIEFLSVQVEVDERYRSNVGEDDTDLSCDGCSHHNVPLISEITASPKLFRRGETVKLSVKIENRGGCKLRYSWRTSCYNKNNCDTTYGSFSDSHSRVTSFKVRNHSPLEKFKMKIKVCNDYHCSYASKIFKIHKSDDSSLEIKKVTATPDSIKPGESTQLKVEADYSNPSRLRYSWTSSCPGSFNSAHLINPIFKAASNAAPQTCTIKVVVSVCNGDEHDSDSISLKIMPKNSKPIIESLHADKTEVDRNENINLSAEASDPDGDVLHYLWTSTCPGNFDDPSSKNPVFSVASDAAYGACSIKVEVNDGAEYVNKDIAVIIRKATINEPPVIISSFQSDDSVSTNGSISFIIRAKDPEGTALSFAWSGTGGTFGTPVQKDMGAYVQSSVEWTAPGCGMDPIIIQVDISDANGLSIRKTFLPIYIINGFVCP